METTEIKLLKNLRDAWNNLDVSHIKDSISEDLEYETEIDFLPAMGKNEVLKYLKNKFSHISENIEEKQIILYSLIGYIPSMNLKPCLFLYYLTDDFMNPTIITIEVKNNLINRIDNWTCLEPEEFLLINDENNFC